MWEACRLGFVLDEVAEGPDEGGIARRIVYGPVVTPLVAYPSG
jgi:hypothetical protein